MSKPIKPTKERILDVSLKLFSEKGYKSTSVRDIAKDVGITQSGLYNHFDKKNEALFKLLMQELYKNRTIREIYNEHFYQENVKKLSSIFFVMMQNETIKNNDPLFLAHEFFAPLFFYQMQVNLLKIDGKSNSSMVTLFEKHIDNFWENNKLVKDSPYS